jgi:peptide/nickel transport system substrate-binding protein
MRRLLFSPLVILAFIQFCISIPLSPPSLAQEWEVRRAQGTLRVVDLGEIFDSLRLSYGEGLVILDKDNNLVPGLSEDWRWINDRTIEFKLRKGVTFHNGEMFNAEAVKVNWEEYRKMEIPWVWEMISLSDETEFETIDDYTVRFVFPEPDGLTLVRFVWFTQFAPAFFAEQKFNEGNWGYPREPGPWGAGPFRLVEGGVAVEIISDRVVLEAYEGYWDRRYPKVQRGDIR